MGGKPAATTAAANDIKRESGGGKFSKTKVRVAMRDSSGRFIGFKKMNSEELAKAWHDRKIRQKDYSRAVRKLKKRKIAKASGSKDGNFSATLEQGRVVDAAANMQNGRAAAIGQGATRASSASSGGSPTIVAPSTTNISSPTNNSSSYSTPMSNLPVSPAAQIIRNSLNF
jgi:hypothetical protein